MVKIFTRCFMIFFFVGCASTGNRVLKTETPATLNTKITEGRTTKSEVRTTFGNPSNVSFTDSGLEIYHYEFTELESKVTNFIPIMDLLAGGYDGTKKTLTVLFDRNDVVSRYALETSPVEIRQGIFK